MKTHPNFKSLDENVQNADKMYDYIGYVIRNQQDLKKKVSVYDTVTTQYFNSNKLQDFKIDLEKIDRLYYINHEKAVETGDDDVGDDFFQLVARMQGEFYIEMNAIKCCNNVGGNCQCGGGGFILVSRDVQYFVKQLLNGCSRYDYTRIYDSLRKDGIYVEEQK